MAVHQMQQVQWLQLRAAAGRKTFSVDEKEEKLLQWSTHGKGWPSNNLLQRPPKTLRQLWQCIK